MALPNVKGLLASFSPLADYLALTAGDGRVKIWDTVSGQLQTEFTDIVAAPTDISTNDTSSGITNGHLSLDYTCMKWRPVSRKKGKNKRKTSLLVLGTGAGDVLALDTAVGELRWKANDCHPGGVRAISFASNGRVLYSTGADGMVCELDWETGNLLGKFRASKKAISCIALSSDGRILATAGAELKLFNLSDKRRLQKFTGHPDSVRDMLFTEDGKHIISSAVGERHVAVWKCDGSKGAAAAACVLSIKQPAISLDCKLLGENGEALCVLAVSETGVAYIWHSHSVEELSMAKPTKVTASLAERESSIAKPGRNSRPHIFAARLQDAGKEDSVMVLVAYGNLAMPVFERLQVEKASQDITLTASHNGALILASQSGSSVKVKGQQTEVTALGPENVEDAIFPIARLETLDDEMHEKKSGKKRKASYDVEEKGNGVHDDQMRIDGLDEAEADEATAVVEDDIHEPTMEEKLRALGISEGENDCDTSGQQLLSTSIPPKADSLIVLLSQALHTDDNLLLEQCLSVSDKKVMMNSVSSLSPTDAVVFLKTLVSKIKSSPGRASYTIPWIRALLLQHASYIMSEASNLGVLNTLYQMIESRVSVFRPILQLSGRLDLIVAQISNKKGDGLPAFESTVVYEDESEDEEELVDAVEDMGGNESEDNSLEDEVMNDNLDKDRVINFGNESD